MSSWSTPSRREAAVLGWVVAAWAALRHGLPSFMDLILMDETASHAAAWRLLHGRGFSLSPETSPLYNAWCALWQLISGGDLVVAYFAQWLATDLLLALVFLLFLRIAGANRIVAAGGAVLWSSLDVVARGWPRVYFFALLVALGAVVLQARNRRPVLLVGLALATLVRPEYALPLVAAATMTALRGRARVWRAAAASLAVAAVLALAVATSGRLWLAFSQHYAWAVSLENPGTIIDYWREHERVTGQAFPGAHSVLAAGRVNPGELGRHVGANVGRLIAVIADALVGRRVGGLGRTLVILVLLAAVVPARAWSQTGAGDPRIAASLALLSLVCLPSLFALPKAVYCLPVLLLGIVGFLRLAAAAVTAAARPLPPLARDAAAVVVAVSVLVACWHASPRPASQPNLEALALLRRAHVDEGRPPWRLLEADGGWCVYVGLDRCETVLLHELPPEGWRATLARSGADAVLVARSWASARAVTADPDFQRFAREPREFGFRLVFTTADRGFFRRTEP